MVYIFGMKKLGLDGRVVFINQYNYARLTSNSDDLDLEVNQQAIAACVFL